MSLETIMGTGRYVVPISEYDSPSSRIRGFREIQEFGLCGPTPMLALTHEAFERYLAFDGITQPVEQAIRQAFRAIGEANPSRGAYIGRAFYVPGIDNPNGPRTAAIFDEDQYVREVIKFYEFVVANGYHQSESNIALVLHPFLNAGDQRDYYGQRLLREDERLPWSGGYAVFRPSPGSPECIEIDATFGADESVKSMPSDKFRVDPVEGIVVSKERAYKDKTLVPGEGTEYRLTPIPDAFRDRQALTDEELILVSREAWKVFQKRPDARVEFIIQADGIYIREIAPRGVIDVDRLFTFAEGETMIDNVVVIQSVADLAHITGDEAIVYLHPDTFRERTTDIFARLVNLGLHRLVALAYGRTTTSHPTKVIREAGFSVIPWGFQPLQDGRRVRVSRNADGMPHIEYLDPYASAVVSLGETALLVQGEDGQKVARIARMRAAGITTPDGFIIRSESLWHWLKNLGVDGKIRDFHLSNHNQDSDIERQIKEIQQLIESSDFPEEIRRQMQEAARPICKHRLIARSTGPEDIDGRSHAGLYVSTPNVSRNDLERATKATIASYFSFASIQALIRTGVDPLRIPVAVLVQEYIPPQAGTLGAVVFTHEKEITIELAVGSPEPIVSHRATDYKRITINRNDGSVTIDRIGDPTFDSDNQLIQSIIHSAEHIEELFRSYQDIELIDTKKRGLIILQARPL